MGRKDIHNIILVTSIDQEWMADDELHRHAEMPCGIGAIANSEAFADDVHDVVAGSICGASSAREANSLDSDLVERKKKERE